MSLGDSEVLTVDRSGSCSAYPAANFSTGIGPDPPFHTLSDLVSRVWISFVHDPSPNNHGYVSRRLARENVDGSWVDKGDWRTR